MFLQFRLTVGTMKAVDEATGITRRAERSLEDSGREGTVSLGCKVMCMNFIPRIVNRGLRDTDNGGIDCGSGGGRVAVSSGEKDRTTITEQQ